MTGLTQLAIVIGVATLLGVLAKQFKQPLLLAYMATGAVVGMFGLSSVADQETFHLFADLGIMLLLFLVGLEMNYPSLKMVGKSSAIVGVTQVAATFGLAFGLSWLLGFSLLSAAYLGVAVSFSSTIIIVKFLSDRRDVNSLYGKISIGVLLLQDAIAIGLLFVLSSISSGSAVDPLALLARLGLGAVLFVVFMFIGRVALPRLFQFIASSQELVFVASLAWLLLVVAAMVTAGFSIEIGGFLAGLALSHLAEQFHLDHKIKPLRDFFIVIFFVLLGSSLVFSEFQNVIWPIIALSLVVLVGNPLVILIIMGLLGHRKQTSFKTGIVITQVSEFSLILIALGKNLGHVSDSVVAVVTAVAIITMITSSYLMMHADQLFRRLSKFLSVFERKHMHETPFNKKKLQKRIILIGAHRIGRRILEALPAEDVLVVDFDPAVVARLEAEGVTTVFADSSDPELFEAISLGSAELLISTSPSIDDNLQLLAGVRRLKKRPQVIVRAETEPEAKVLYDKGADYVLLPHFTAGQFIGAAVSSGKSKQTLKELRQRDLAVLK